MKNNTFRQFSTENGDLKMFNNCDETSHTVLYDGTAYFYTKCDISLKHFNWSEKMKKKWILHIFLSIFDIKWEPQDVY